MIMTVIACGEACNGIGKFERRQQKGSEAQLLSPYSVETVTD